MDETARRAQRVAIGRTLRWGIWATLTAVFVVFVAFIRVPTYLGLVAPAWDKEGIEYVWRVWWRARTEMVDVEQIWLFTGLLLGLAMTVVLASSAALWLILVRDEPAADAPAGYSTPSPPP